jgi:hypothetical protein
MGPTRHVSTIASGSIFAGRTNLLRPHTVCVDDHDFPFHDVYNCIAFSSECPVRAPGRGLTRLHIGCIIRFLVLLFKEGISIESDHLVGDSTSSKEIAYCFSKQQRDLWV